MKQFDPEVFAQFCRKNIDLGNADAETYYYRSLSACILDCVYSLRAKYFSVTVPVVDRYAAKYMKGDRLAAGDTLDDFIAHMKEFGCKNFAAELLKNNQKQSGRLKSEVCYDLAANLLKLGVHTIEDLQQAQVSDGAGLAACVRGVKGIGDAAESYLYMLAGDVNRCKPDVHLLQSMKDAYGCTVEVKYCQEIMEGAVSILRSQYPSLTVRGLDALIWEKYRAKANQTRRKKPNK